MVTGTALADPEGRLADEAGRVESEATHPAHPERNAAETEWNLPTWEDIVRTHSARVYRLAYRLTGNPHDAEDLTQEVFVRVFRSLSSYTPGTFEGWLHRITTNLFLDMARRRSRVTCMASPPCGSGSWSFWRSCTGWAARPAPRGLSSGPSTAFRCTATSNAS